MIITTIICCIKMPANIWPAVECYQKSKKAKKKKTTRKCISKYWGSNSLCACQTHKFVTKVCILNLRARWKAIGMSEKLPPLTRANALQICSTFGLVCCFCCHMQCMLFVLHSVNWNIEIWAHHSGAYSYSQEFLYTQCHAHDSIAHSFHSFWLVANRKHQFISYFLYMCMAKIFLLP